MHISFSAIKAKWKYSYYTRKCVYIKTTGRQDHWGNARQDFLKSLYPLAEDDNRGEQVCLRKELQNFGAMNEKAFSEVASHQISKGRKTQSIALEYECSG